MYFWASDLFLQLPFRYHFQGPNIKNNKNWDHHSPKNIPAILSIFTYWLNVNIYRVEIWIVSLMISSILCLINHDHLSMLYIISHICLFFLLIPSAWFMPKSFLTWILHFNFPHGNLISRNVFCIAFRALFEDKGDLIPYYITSLFKAISKILNIA